MEEREAIQVDEVKGRTQVMRAGEWMKWRQKWREERTLAISVRSIGVREIGRGMDGMLKE